MRRADRPASRGLQRLGWLLVALSFPVWGASFVIPVLPLPLELPQRLGLSVSAFVASEIAFWLGVLLLGPTVLARLRRPKVHTGRSLAGRHVALLAGPVPRDARLLALCQALLREGAELLLVGECDAELPEHPRLQRLSSAEDVAALQAAGDAKLDMLINAYGLPPEGQASALALSRAWLPALAPGGVLAQLANALPPAEAQAFGSACIALQREHRQQGLTVCALQLAPAGGDPAASSDFILQALLARRRRALQGRGGQLAQLADEAWLWWQDRRAPPHRQA
ncbi:hypothetical protein RQP53_17390 [Paucibacter sp. APW11]|uniref:Uncharacterized protein n=1 Tax=Roseateles aquae TaxID=3077235 RepID=A0ABU3PEL8_9BURK|nr:hypothetical protein [Paucibacter sp. APW11]MDT9001056.1 hypothetical protein [Paucibacter sp. APW11]